MGLDVEVYKNLKVVENPVLNDEEYPVDWENEWLPGVGMDWSEENWPGRGEGVDSKKVYRYEDCWHFHSGSYSWYNYYRDKLKAFSDGSNDFMEQIEFADNEGVIGPIVSAKLAQDYQKNYEAAKKYAITLERSEEWLKEYEEWMKAFIMASDNGAVRYC